ncbi:class I SAM-dependent methyltransferase [Duganella sp. HH101]|uniref:class I SAM-dependent methyltransferase n=1 Tax=Duganella sp. HH101 TaxID=1781066 RepID=UPI000874F9CC|nr:class I SAM-dependent methyltransferase [Duganella sp. HH101]OFA01817.1 putative methyltransferase regulatory domain protein [Duganella sp. HH101]
MTDWTSGYVADIGYTYGCYDLLNPLRARLALLKAGVVLPQTGTACELGYGQGLSANIHAAASSTEWYGTDFNPAQAGYAQELAACIENGPQLFDQSFAEFCSRTDLPDFDFIGLHGIWSWISDENRAIIVDFARRKLKVGGLLYISYNTQPGFAAMVPVRNLMVQHAAIMEPPGAGVVAKVDGAIAFINKLLATEPIFARLNPQIAERLKKMASLDRHYLAHEYFNRDWLPMSFADMAGWLSSAKLDFACTAAYGQLVPALNLTPERQALLNDIPDAVFRESVFDFMINQQFRRDYWVKGKRKLQGSEYAEQLRAHRVILCAPAETIKLTASGALGEGTLAEAIYAPLIKLLSDHAVRSIGDIEQALSGNGIVLTQLHEACLLLADKGALANAQDPSVTARRRPQTARLNQRLLRQAYDGGEVSSLASPVTGSGVAVSRFQQLFINAIAEGKQQPSEWAYYVWQILKASRQTISLEGVALTTDEENLSELGTQATEFRDRWLPLLRALGIV